MASKRSLVASRPASRSIATPLPAPASAERGRSGEDSPWRLPGRRAGPAVGFIALYLLTALWGRELASGGVTPWFPPPGLTVALLVVGGLGYLPAVVIAELLSALLVFDVGERFSVLQVVLNTALVVGAYAVGPALLRAAGISPRLRRLRDVLLLFALGAALGPLLAAVGGSAVRVWADAVPASDYVESVRTWFVGDALGVVTVAPPAMMLLAGGRPVPGGTPVAERLLQGLAVIAVPIATLLLDGGGSPELAYLSLVPVIWVALRHGIAGAVPAASVQNVTVTIVAGSDLGVTPELVALQGLMTLIAATGLVVGSVVTERGRTERQLEHRTRHDALTGLPNREQLLDHIGDLASTAAPGPALALVDLDKFAHINELEGPQRADEVLTFTADRLCSAVGDGCVCARFGGDEFAVVDPTCSDPVDAEALGRRVLDAVNTVFGAGNRELTLSASVGVALADPGETAGDLVRGANIALQAAKANGRGSVVVLDEALAAPFRLRHRLDADLPRALARGDLRLAYQPIEAVAGPACAWEALLRWRHPVHGDVPAALVVDIAEDAGLMARLDTWVLDEVARQMAAWRAAGTARAVSLNVSAPALLDDGYVDAVVRWLDSEAFPSGSSLWIEVTEHDLIRDLDRAAAVLSRLRGAGVAVYVDDFGTGFSSLTYLERLPLDGVKLDRMLIERLTHEPRARAMVAAVIDLAHALKLLVVAEGVEGAAQRSALAELECDAVQGFHVGMPVAPEAVTGGG